MDSLIGKTLAHYRILEKIGAGGMGEVYLARDENLQRDVALKVLPPHAIEDETARWRFRREALALSKLNHPHVCTIHDFDSQKGIDFLVMEHVKGETLARRLRGGPLAEDEVMRLGRQIGEALGAAHEQGVIHRDLKPGDADSSRHLVKSASAPSLELSQLPGVSRSYESEGEGHAADRSCCVALPHRRPAITRAGEA